MANRQIRPIRIDGNIAYVPLTKGYEAVIDAADAALICRWNWSAEIDGHTVYAKRKDCSGPKPRKVFLHRAIMGEPEALQVDHRDGNGLNNRRANLREATRQQNMHNQRTRCDSTSGFKGVGPSKGKWQARIKLHGKVRHLGYFHTPEVAHAAYCKASKELHGDYGRTQ
jgi:hypothetical protein